MNIIDKNSPRVEKEVAISLGNFDGLHIGHRHLIETMKNLAKQKNYMTSVFTFANHPIDYMEGKKVVAQISNKTQKYDLFESMGIDILYDCEFDLNMMKMEPEDFIFKVLIEKLNLKLVVVGFNYRFGNKAKGDTTYLRELGEKYGFEVVVLNPIKKEGHVVSSTVIRNLIKEGEFEKANELLGRRYSIVGEVVRGKNIGRKLLGFPTANLNLSTKYVIPKFGVYKTKTIVEDIEYLSITNVGKNPTFEDRGVNVETHIFDFDKDIYGKNISVEFESFIREEKKFESKEELIKQMEKDVLEALKK